jgi:hypothetical protein
MSRDAVGRLLRSDSGPLERKPMAESAPIPVLLELMFGEAGDGYAERRLPPAVHYQPEEDEEMGEAEEAQGSPST